MDQNADELTVSPVERDRRAHLKRVVYVSFGIVAVALLVVAVYSQRDEFLAAVAQLTWATIALAFGAGFIALLANMMSWRGAMSAVGAKIPILAASRVFFLSQLGKYVPGSIWPVLAQMEMTRDRGISRSRSGTASLVAMAVGVVTSAVVAAITLVLFVPGAMNEFWYVVAIVPAGCVMLMPPVLAWILQVFSRVTRRTFSAPEISWSGMARAVVWSTAMWAAFGVSAWVIVKDLTGTAGPGYLLSTGAFAFAWLIGFLVFIAPAGVGAREAALVLAFAGTLDRADALVVAIVSRVLLTLVDALAGLLGFLIGRLSRHDASPVGTKTANG